MAEMTPLERDMADRLTASSKYAEKRFAEGNAYLPFLHGGVPEAGKGDSLTEQERSVFGENWRLTSYPAHGEVRVLMLESLTGSVAEWENEHPQLPPDATDEEKRKAELRRRKYRLYEQLARAIYREFDIHKHKRMAIDDSMTYGLGCFETFKDKARRLCGFRYASIRRVMVDSETENDPLGECIRWWSLGYTMSLGDAKKMAKDVWGNADFKFMAEQLEVETIASTEPAPSKMVRVLYVFVRGDSPWLNNASMAKKRQEVGEDTVYDGSFKVLVFEEHKQKGVMDDVSCGYRYIGQIDYPYPTDLGQCPLTLFGINPTSEEYWQPPAYRRSHSLQVALNWALRYINTDAWLSARRLIFFLEGALGDKDLLEKVLKDPRNLMTVPVKDRAMMEQAFKIIEFGKSNPELKEVMNIARTLYEQASAKDIFSGRATTGRETATRAAISGERMNLIIGGMMDSVDSALLEAMRKAIMACRATMNAEDVARWVGDEYMYWTPDPVTGGMISEVWPDVAPDLETLRREIEINLKPRSTRHVNPEQRRLDMEFVLAKSSEWVSKVIEANSINPQLAAEVTRVYNVSMRSFGRLLNLPYADEMMIDVSKALIPPMQPAMAKPGGGGGPGAPRPDAPPGADALANAMENMGLENNGQGPLAEQISMAQGGGY